MSLSEQQLAARRIGGSSAAAAVGLSRWQSRYALWCQMTGQTAPFEGNEYTKWGTILEAPVRQEYVDQTGRTLITPAEQFVHPEHEFMTANVDGHTPAMDLLYEGKTARMARDWGEPGTDEIPQEYAIQIQHYMAVTKIPIADVAVLIGGSDFRIYTIEGDEELQGLLIEGEREFWRMVQEGQPPEPETLEDVKRRWPVSKSVCVEATNEVAALSKMLRMTKEQIKQLEATCDEREAALKQHLAEADTLTYQGKTLATWKSAKGRKSFDTKAFAAAHPDLYAEFTRESEGSRRFLLKEIDE